MSPAEDKFYKASVWARKTLLPYRDILEAARCGELEAKKTSRKPGASYRISTSAMNAWLSGCSPRQVEPGRVARGPRSRSGRSQRPADPASSPLRERIEKSRKRRRRSGS